MIKQASWVFKLNSVSTVPKRSGGNGKGIMVLDIFSDGGKAMRSSTPFEGKTPCAALIVALSIWCCADASSQVIIPSIPADGEVSEALIDTAIESLQIEAGMDDDARARTIEALRDAKVQVQNRVLAVAGKETSPIWAPATSR